MEILLLSIKQETGAREKQNRELELGREVQERPSPQQYPAIPGFDYAGGCRPALGVGGDYCDFTPVANGGLSIAIGDVSGKGIPAALRMATLRAFLRSAQNRYATFRARANTAICWWRLGTASARR